MHNRRYGFVRFMVDIVLTIITGGLWLLYLIFKVLRKSI